MDSEFDETARLAAQAALNSQVSDFMKKQFLAMQSKNKRKLQTDPSLQAKIKMSQAGRTGTSMTT